MTFDIQLPPVGGPRGATSAPGQPYEIKRGPARSIVTPLALPGDTVVDLSVSGAGTDGRQFDPYNGSLAPILPANSPVIITFNPAGGVDYVYVGNVSFRPFGPIHLLIGRRQNVVDPLDPMTNFADPTIPKNLTDPSCLWVTINHRTGAVTTTENTDSLVLPAATTVPERIKAAREFARNAIRKGGRLTMSRMHAMRPASLSFGRRPGVSLLEVTFAIGVVMVGLLGVASLLPLAGYQASRGRLADKAAHFGRQSYREFVVRGMGQGNAVWALTDGSLFDRNTTGTLINPPANAPQPYLPAPNDPASPGPPYFFPRSFCLDPRFVSRNGFTVTGGYDARRFPYVPIASGPSTGCLELSGILDAPDQSGRFLRHAFAVGD